jgi:hypothetical protein|tara:strand:- start:228 stop:401 length:174 start_codon:yes stop_codon:yes gene_type:complete
VQPIDHFILQKIFEREQRKEEQREGLRIPLPVPGPPHAPPAKDEKCPPKKPIIIDMT